MNIINSIKSYVLEDEPKVTIYKNKINIENYKDIGHFDSNKIVVKLIDGEVLVNGSNLVVSKLMNDEMLITGEFNNIEFR